MLVYVQHFVIELRRNGLVSALRKTFGFLRFRAASALLPGRRQSFGTTSHNPLISVIVVSYNSGDDLPACLRSLAAQSYSHHEVIVVENGTSDTEAVVRSILPEATWLRAPGNVGFAEGNNLGLAAARGELLALVNPDARLDGDCLFELLHPFRYHGDTAVTTPKTRFWTRFVDIHVDCDEPFVISAAAVESQLAYRKFFIREGLRAGDELRSRTYMRRAGEAGNLLVLRLPVDGSTIEIPVPVQIPVKSFTSGRGDDVHLPDEQGVRVRLSLRPEDHVGAGWIVNNAGTGMRTSGPFDIGFGEKDEGRYDAMVAVPAFCGCVALIRRAALIGRPIFRPEFFAYYEDSELSHYCRTNGYRIYYNPRALAWHKHSVSSSEGSPLWTTLVGRSRLIYESYRKSSAAREHLTTFLGRPDRYAALPPALAATLERYDARIGAEARPGRTIGVYNSFWNTMGGGEAHALGVALAAAAADDDIYLIGESDFDIVELERRFGFDLSRCRKLVLSVLTRDMTSRFDIFINSTYSSNLGSAAKRSFYIVSFPHQAIRRKILADYTFLHNSRFTAGWARRYWGPTRNTVVCPTFSVKAPPPEDYAAKEKLVLSIGRFTPQGHAKNQHAMVEAFAATKADPDFADWRLALVGGLDRRETADGAYFARIAEMAQQDARVTLLPNCPRDTVNDLLAKASIYLHAAGLGQPESRPEQHEHFGIAPLEACLFGAWPIAYAIGGPADLIGDLKVGETFRDFDDMVAVLARAMRGAGAIDHEAVARAARAFRAGNDDHLRRAIAGTEPAA